MARIQQLLLVAFAACTASPPEPSPPAKVPVAAKAAPAVSASAEAKVEPAAIDAGPPVTAAVEVPPAAPVKPDFASWLRERLPPGGELTMRDGVASVTHVVSAGETSGTLAKAYFGISEAYFLSDYEEEIVHSARAAKASFRPGQRIPIPSIVAAPFKSADDERMPWPADRAVRGFYVRGATATLHMFPWMLERMAERDINAVVLDSKDYDGPVTYASNVPLVKETGAARGAPIRDLARVIRFIHKKGVHAIIRVSCFNDEFMSKARPKLAVQSKWGAPYPIGWLDPSNTDSQDYILSLVQEAVDSGADEVELDYVRFPVLGIKGADFHLKERNLTQISVIRDFVRRAHAVTSARKVPLSLDVFGVIAQGHRADIEALGQDLAVLSPEVEAISPMVYPSHYSVGFYGWANPGDHPEIVGIGVKGSLEQMRAAVPHGPGGTLAVIRPWIQAENYKTTNYSPQYLKDEISSSDKNGGTGWLMWNPQQEYSYAWQAVPKKAAAVAASAGVSGGRVKSTKPARD